MFPPKEIVHRALHSDSGPLDPLTLSRQIEVDVREVNDWKLEKVFEIEGGTLSILSLGRQALHGLILCLDRGFERECIRISPQGKLLASTVGSRIGPVMSVDLSPVDVVSLESASPPSQMYDLVNRLQCGDLARSVPLEDSLTLDLPTIHLDDEEVR